jgi:hypothetical protein
VAQRQDGGALVTEAIVILLILIVLGAALWLLTGALEDMASAEPRDIFCTHSGHIDYSPTTGTHRCLECGVVVGQEVID